MGLFKLGRIYEFREKYGLGHINRLPLPCVELTETEILELRANDKLLEQYFKERKEAKEIMKLCNQWDKEAW